jgi:excisionase family DNA binding protein
MAKTKLAPIAPFVTRRVPVEMTVADVADYLLIPYSTACYLVNTGRIANAQKRGRQWFVPLAAIDAYVAEKREAAAKKIAERKR